jgi:type VI secretion system protein ImpA
MIDIESLLKPISDGAPSGPDLRFDAENDRFEQIRQNRSVLDPALDPDGKGKDPNWSAVARIAEEVLRNDSKDLEVIGWLTEALLHLERFEGLQQGLTLMRRTLESYWESVHPGIDEGAIALAIRARPLSWLGSSSFLRAFKACRLAPTSAADTSWFARERALALDDETLSAERRAELRAGGQIGTAEWDAAFGSLGRTELDRLHELLSQCQGELRAIDAFCGERFAGEEGPNLFPLQTLLDAMLEFLVARGAAAPNAEPSAEEQSVAEASIAAGPAAPAAAAGPIASRQDALKRLREIGEFFKRNEPHSPISLLIARAVRWGDMTFEELVRDLARSADLKQIWETLGVGAGEKEKNGK